MRREERLVRDPHKSRRLLLQYRVDCRRKRTRVHPEISTNDVTKANLCHSAHRHELERQHRTDTHRLQRSERRGQAQRYARHSLNDATILGLAPLPPCTETTTGTTVERHVGSLNRSAVLARRPQLGPTNEPRRGCCRGRRHANALRNRKTALVDGNDVGVCTGGGNSRRDDRQHAAACHPSIASMAALTA